MGEVVLKGWSGSEVPLYMNIELVSTNLGYNEQFLSILRKVVESKVHCPRKQVDRQREMELNFRTMLDMSHVGHLQGRMVKTL